MKNLDTIQPITIEPILMNIPLPLEKNPLNDCGVLSLQMILLSDKHSEDFSLENLRNRVGKTFEEGTSPANICKVLKEEGYKVKYFSSIDIESVAKNDPKTDFNKWDPRVIGAVNAAKGSSLVINAEKLHDSAIWLNKEENKGMIENKNLSIKEVADLLREGKKVIALVKDGSHYVVIVGVDNKNIYFNDPATNETPTQKSKTHLDFLNYWAQRPDMRDAIVVSILPKD